MRTTVELPDELLTRAKTRAAIDGVSIKVLFIQALEQKLAETPVKPRLDPPVLRTGGSKFDVTRKQIDEAMFG